jgi:hypothetical protein
MATRVVRERLSRRHQVDKIRELRNERRERRDERRG